MASSFPFFTWFSRLILLISVCLCASCGGGGGGGGGSGSTGSTSTGTGSPPPTSTNSLHGYVVMSPVGGATVKLYEVSASGVKTLLETVTTNGDGSYAFTASVGTGKIVMVEATGGTYVDEKTHQTLSLNTPIRAVLQSTGASMRVSPSVFSEIAVRFLERASTPDWSASNVSAANLSAANFVGSTSVLDYSPVDLETTVPTIGTANDDILLSLFSGGFSGFAGKLDSNPQTEVATALDALYQLAMVDPHDDRYLPAFIGSLIGYVDSTVIDDANKVSIKTAFLFPGDNPTIPAGMTLADAIPSGVSSGSATAMQNDAMQIVNYAPHGSVFNSRGALIGYPLPDNSGKWRVLYTGSVSELFGDGEVSIGRWNGGLVVDTARDGNDFSNDVSNPQPILFGSQQYAVALPATDIPTCGKRRISIAATTKPSLTTLSAINNPIVDLTSDSAIVFLYMEKTYIGVDIGVKLTDGSIVRYRTVGALTAPWADQGTLTAAALDNGFEIFPDTQNSLLGNRTLTVHGLAAGSGANEFAAKLMFGQNAIDSIEMAAAFRTPNSTFDSSGCRVSDSFGTAINPAPADGNYYVFTGAGQFSTSGAPVATTFRTAGQLSGIAPLTIPSTTQIYQLAGTADASIGVIEGPFTLSGGSYNQAMPYAVASGASSVPSTGVKHYALVASTTPVVDLPGAYDLQFTSGLLTSATLDINFGEHPVGTVNAYYGTVQLYVAGTIGGLPFTISEPGAAPNTPASTLLYRGDGTFGGSQSYAGALSGTNGDDVVVRYRTSVGTANVMGALLFHAL